MAAWQDSEQFPASHDSHDFQLAVSESQTLRLYRMIVTLRIQRFHNRTPGTIVGGLAVMVMVFDRVTPSASNQTYSARTSAFQDLSPSEKWVCTPKMVIPVND